MFIEGLLVGAGVVLLLGAAVAVIRHARTSSFPEELDLDRFGATINLKGRNGRQSVPITLLQFHDAVSRAGKDESALSEELSDTLNLLGEDRLTPAETRIILLRLTPLLGELLQPLKKE